MKAVYLTSHMHRVALASGFNAYHAGPDEWLAGLNPPQHWLLNGANHEDAFPFLFWALPYTADAQQQDVAKLTYNCTLFCVDRLRDNDGIRETYIEFSDRMQTLFESFVQGMSSEGWRLFRSNVNSKPITGQVSGYVITGPVLTPSSTEVMAIRVDNYRVLVESIQAPCPEPLTTGPAVLMTTSNSDDPERTLLL